MLKQVRTTRLQISEADIIYSELAELIQSADEIGDHFRDHFVPTENQQELFDLIEYSEAPEDQPLHILLYGSVGSGKSTAALALQMKAMLDHPGTFILGVRRTYVEIEDSLYPKAEEWFRKHGIPNRPNKKNTKFTLSNSSEYILRSAERTAKSDSDKADHLGSMEFSGAILEEADEIPEEFAKTVSGRLRQKSGVRRKIVFYICNPPSEDHWLYEWFFKDNNPHDSKSRYRVHYMPVEANVKHVGQGYIDSIHDDYKDNPALYLRMVKGLFGPAVKGYPIFQNHFKYTLHVASSSIWKNWDPESPMYRCWDFGFIHPAIVVFQDMLNIGQLRIYRAILGAKTLLDPFADKYLNQLNRDFPQAKWVDCVDPAGVQRSDKVRKTSVDILKAKKLTPKFRRYDIEYGLNIIAEQLSTMIPTRNGPEPALIIDPCCKEMIDALLLGYCQEKDLNDDVVKPVKDGRYDHVVDALRYGIVFARRPSDSSFLRHSKGSRGGSYNSVGPAKDWEPGMPTNINSTPVSRHGRGLSRSSAEKRTDFIGHYNFGKRY